MSGLMNKFEGGIVSKHDDLDTTTALRWAADDLEFLLKLLNDKLYIQIKADYNKGHLSHYGWLKSKDGA